MREIDLKNFSVRTDLITELPIDSNLEERYEEDKVVARKITLNKEQAKRLSKKEGTYLTIEFEDLTDQDNFLKVKEVFKKEMKKFSLTGKKTLVVGLGNRFSTPDALGPKTTDEILVTSYLEAFGPLEDGFSSVAIFAPGVTGQTGIETSSLLKNVIDAYQPDQVIAIDALASRSIKRVCRTIQVSTAGITPGSGVGNHRSEISYETLGIPVLAVGVPTVVDAVSVVSDTLQFLMKEYAFQKKFLKKKVSRFVRGGMVNYLEKEVNPSEEEKCEILGMVGTLTEEEIKQLLLEVLTPVGYNLIVTPKEIDFVLEKIISLISSAFNEIMHPKLEKGV